ncbi:hypothetical protein [Rhizobium sp. FKY42]|nr:hypothetical protein [Rhizobium sp. FKY42]
MKTATTGEGDGRGGMEGQRPGEGDEPLPGLPRRGTSQRSGCGVINRRYD